MDYHRNKRILGYLLTLGLLSPFGGCKCKPEEELTEESSPAGANPDAGTGTETGPALRDKLSLLTPEQMSEQIYRVFGIREGHLDNNGNFHDSLIEGYGVALGGIDYHVASRRDPLPRVQTLLITRSISAHITNKLVSDAGEKKEGRFMDIADPFTDRPFLDEDATRSEAEQSSQREAESRWKEQIVAFYWKLFGREPSEAEMSLLRAAFIEAYHKNNQFCPMAWVTVVYALVSSLEFWST